MNQGLLSIILLSYQSSKNIVNSYELIARKLEAEAINFEIIIIDDASKDNSFSIAKTIAKKDSRVRTYQLAKNCTSPYAQFAGLKMSKGDCAAPIPDDGQRPIEHIIEMYRHWQNGQKIIIGYRKSRSDGKINDILSNSYYNIMNTMSDIKFPKGGSDGYLIDREVIDILNTVSQRNTTPTIELLHLGYNPLFVGYERPVSKNASRWTVSKKLRLAFTTFFSSSHFPLRLISYLGVFTFLVSIILIIAIVISKIFSDNTLFGLPIQGWATLVVLIALFNGVILLCLGIVAEYLWRIYEETKSRPPYHIKNNDDE
jgi:polyisoprenyl-phosphate glycosyltransferase